MNVIVFILPLLLAAACGPSLAGPAHVLRVNEPARSVPVAVADTRPRAPNVAQPTDQTLPAPVTGRRLTPAELKQLREQVRQQWPMRQEVSRPAQSQPVGHVVPRTSPGSDLMSLSGAPLP